MPRAPQGGNGDYGSGDMNYPTDQMQLTGSAMTKQTNTLITQTTKNWQTVAGNLGKITVTSTHEALRVYAEAMERGLGQLLEYRMVLGQRLVEASVNGVNVDTGSAKAFHGRTHIQ